MKLYLADGSWINTLEPHDISIPIINNDHSVKAWYVSNPRFEPVRANGFVGAVAEGGSVNFREIYFNPHGHGTHTECLGHITSEVFSINQQIKSFFCKAQVISIVPISQTADDGKIDRLILPEQLNKFTIDHEVQALIIRTLPNERDKMSRNYSSANAPYLDADCIEFMNSHQIKHLLIDTPSVDREEDNGVLAFHHAFWNVPSNPDFSRTITELVYINDQIEDGVYLLDLQVAAFENDAAPSRPVLYTIYKSKED